MNWKDKQSVVPSIRESNADWSPRRAIQNRQSEIQNAKVPRRLNGATELSAQHPIF